MKVDAKNVSPGVAAVIAAAVAVMMGDKKIAALRIKPSHVWTMAGRQKLMNSH